MKNLLEAMQNLKGLKTESIDKVDKEEALNNFKAYVNDIGLSEEEIDEDIINEYFTELFYDLETEEDMDNLNELESIIRKEYLGEE